MRRRRLPPTRLDQNGLPRLLAKKLFRQLGPLRAGSKDNAILDVADAPRSGRPPRPVNLVLPARRCARAGREAGTVCGALVAGGRALGFGAHHLVSRRCPRSRPLPTWFRPSRGLEAGSPSLLAGRRGNGHRDAHHAKPARSEPPRSTSSDPGPLRRLHGGGGRLGPVGNHAGLASVRARLGLSFLGPGGPRVGGDPRPY
jgi:hypothetical protein